MKNLPRTKDYKLFGRLWEVIEGFEYHQNSFLGNLTSNKQYIM